MNALWQLNQIVRFIWAHPLNRGHRMAALIRFLAWQVRSRLAGGKIVVPWVDDASVMAGEGDTALTGNLYAGLMEFEDMAFLLHALRSTDLFVDVGANMGAYTILASKVVRSESLTFEPVPSTADRLMDQVHLNRIEENVRLRRMGVGREAGSLPFTCDSGAMNKVSVSDEREGSIRVPVTTLDLEVPLHQPVFMKIDVEGFEFNVLEGAKNVLSSNALIALIVELNGRGEEFGHTNEEVHQKLLSHDLIPVGYDPWTRSVTRIASYNRNDANTVYVKDLELIRERCLTAPARVIHTAHGIRL